MLMIFCLFSTTFEHHLAISLVNVNFFKQVRWYSWDMKCRPMEWDLTQLTLRRWLCEIHPITSELHSFLGLASDYRKFCPKFATVAEPLKCLTESKSKFQWTQKCDAAFKRLHERLTTSTLLAYPKFYDSFRFNCHASNHPSELCCHRGIRMRNA